MYTLWIWTWHQRRLGKSFRGPRILSSGWARHKWPAFPILNPAFRGARVISMTIQLFHMTTKRGLAFFLMPCQSLKPTWSSWASLLLHFNHIWGPSFYFIPFTPPTLGGGTYAIIGRRFTVEILYPQSSHLNLVSSKNLVREFEHASSYHVRHEVNGKHRVLAAYIIFTLEEAYRYNDRQWLVVKQCVWLLITSGVLTHLRRLLEYMLLWWG